MRVITLLTVPLAVFSGIGVPATGFAQAQTPIRVATAPSVATPASTAATAAAVTNKFTFVLFWKDDNAATQKFAAASEAAAAKQSDRAAWKIVNVKDSAQREIVERYKLERAPMPLVLCVAPNGAITSAVTQPLTDELVDIALVTPAMADCMKSLQNGKIVIVHVKPHEKSPLPAAATDFVADKSFKERTEVVSVLLTDPSEARLFKDMAIDRAALKESMLLVMAPPKAFIGKYLANATKDQIAAALHAAGKCCDDPNCEHNKAK